METPTKERLVGAIVLVAIVVVVVPELLTGPRAPTDAGTGTGTRSLEAPAPTGVRTVTIDLSSEQRRVTAGPVAAAPATANPVAVVPATPTSAAATPAPVVEPSAAAPGPGTDAAVPVTPTPLQAGPDTRAAAGAPAVPASAQGWVVQLGSFASRANAERLAAELRGRGYSGFVSEYRGAGRVLFRVRVGPEQDRARAEAIAQRLARDGTPGTVAPHP